MPLASQCQMSTAAPLSGRQVAASTTVSRSVGGQPEAAELEERAPADAPLCAEERRAATQNGRGHYSCQSEGRLMGGHAFHVCSFPSYVISGFRLASTIW